MIAPAKMHCWVNVDAASAILAQHYTNIQLTSLTYMDHTKSIAGWINYAFKFQRQLQVLASLSGRLPRQNAVSMLVHRLRRWTSIDPAFWDPLSPEGLLDQRGLLSGVCLLYQPITRGVLWGILSTLPAPSRLLLSLLGLPGVPLPLSPRMRLLWSETFATLLTSNVNNYISKQCRSKTFIKAEFLCFYNCSVQIPALNKNISELKFWFKKSDDSIIISCKM